MPGEEGGWGLRWSTGADGGLTGDLELFPLPEARHTLEVRVIYGGGRESAWSEGDWTPDSDAPIDVHLADLPDLESTAAEVDVLVTAADPESGVVLAHAGAPPIYAARDSDGGAPVLLDRAALTSQLGAALSGDGEFDDVLVGKEVTP